MMLTRFRSWLKASASRLLSAPIAALVVWLFSLLGLPVTPDVEGQIGGVVEFLAEGLSMLGWIVVTAVWGAIHKLIDRLPWFNPTDTAKPELAGTYGLRKAA